MRRLTLLVVILLNLFLVKVIFAQSPAPSNNAYATAYQNFIDKNGAYQSSHNDYLTARANYLASGSLDSQAKAMQATLNMLQARDDLMVAYISAMSAKVQASQGISDGDKSSLTSQFNNEISWYNNHRGRLASAGSLNDLVSDSDEAKTRYNNSSFIIIYTGLIDLGAGDNNFIRGELNGEINTLQAKIAEIQSNQDKDVSTIQRSLVDVQNKISRSQDKDGQAVNSLDALKPSNINGGKNIFQAAQGELTDSNSYLKEANQGLLQIITLIKTN